MPLLRIRDLTDLLSGGRLPHEQHRAVISEMIEGLS